MSDDHTPKAGPEHKLMEPMVGVFHATVKLWFGPGDPMVQTGTMVNSWVLDGLYMQQDYTGDPAEGPFPRFLGKGYWGYNQTTGNYEGYWIDNASTTMVLEHGEVDETGKAWTMKSEIVHPFTRELTKRESLIRVTDQDRHTMETLEGPEGKMMKSMEIEFVRKT